MKIKTWLNKVWNGPKRFFGRLWRGRFVISDVFKHEHRFIVLDTDTYKEKVSFRLSGLNLFVTFGIVALVLVLLTAILLAFTPLRELIPGYSNAKMTQQTYANARVIDSIETRLHAQEELLADIQDIMLGKDPAARHAVPEPAIDSVKVEPQPYLHSQADTLLRQDIESRGGEQYYAVPFEGRTVRKYDNRSHFYGIDIAGAANTKAMSVQSGYVLLADEEEGNVTLVVQHWGDDVSIYKAYGKSLKAVGDEVDAGEPLLQVKARKGQGEAILHFELRKAGAPVDPARFIQLNSAPAKR